MSKKKKCLLGAAAVIVILAGVIGCAAVKQEAKGDETEAGAVTTITWWSFPVLGDEQKMEQELIEAFEEQHPDIQVKAEHIDFTTGPEKIKLAIKNGTICDVLLDAPGRIIDYGKNGYLVELNDFFDEGYEADMVNEQLVSACRDGEGNAYMYPLSAAPFYMAFNKEYLDEADVTELVKEGWTTDDFTNVLTALQEEGYVPGSLFCADQGGDQGTRALMANLYDSSVVNDTLTEYTLNDEAGKKAFSYIQSAVKQGLILNGTLYNGSEDIERFASGQSSFTFLWGPSQQNSNQTLLNLNQVETVEVPLPAESGTPKLEYLVNGFAVFDHKNEKKTEAAKEFVKFVCDDATWGKKAVVASGCFPVRKSFGNLYADARMQTIGSWAKYYGTYYNTIDGFGTMRGYWYNSLQKLINKELDASQIADEFVDLANQTLHNQG